MLTEVLDYTEHDGITYTYERFRLKDTFGDDMYGTGSCYMRFLDGEQLRILFQQKVFNICYRGLRFMRIRLMYRLKDYKGAGTIMENDLLPWMHVLKLLVERRLVARWM